MHCPPEGPGQAGMTESELPLAESVKVPLNSYLTLGLGAAAASAVAGTIMVDVAMTSSAAEIGRHAARSFMQVPSQSSWWRTLLMSRRKVQAPFFSKPYGRTCCWSSSKWHFPPRAQDRAPAIPGPSSFLHADDIGRDQSGRQIGRLRLTCGHRRGGPNPRSRPPRLALRTT